MTDFDNFHIVRSLNNIAPDKILWDASIWIQQRVHREKESLEGILGKGSSILLIELTRLGDVIEMIPAIRIFVQSFPGADVHVIVEDEFVSLLDTVVHGVKFHGAVRSDTLHGFLGAIRLSRKLRPRLAISMSPAKRNALLCSLSAAPLRAGYLTFVNAQAQYLHPVGVQSIGFALRSSTHYGMEHISRRALKICEALGFDDHTQQRDSEPEDLKLNEGQHVVPDELSGRPYVVIHPFSGWSYKSWPMQRFQALANYLSRSLLLDVAFICKSDESPSLDSLRKAFAGNRSIHFVATTDLTFIYSILMHAALFVGNDSGPLHIASMAGVPCVGLFGPAPPELTAPKHSQVMSHFHRLDCCPCELVHCVRPDKPCMELISTDEVIGTVRQFFDHPTHGEAPKNA